MIVQTVLLAPKTDMPEEEFHKYLAEVHAPLSRELPGLKKYEIFRVTFSYPDNSVKAAAYLTFENEQARRAALKSDEGKTVQADAQNFCDVSKMKIYVTDMDTLKVVSG